MVSGELCLHNSFYFPPTTTNLPILSSPSGTANAMDINNVSFGPMLLGIIEQISTSHFVAFDIEMSGIASKPAANRGKQSLQERYLEIKEAAEKYAIIQIGITCVEEYDGVYVLRPYNFHLNPIIGEDLEIERIWCNQDSAIRFLLDHGFDMAAPFTKGVQYLSREEEKIAKKRLTARLDRSKFDDQEIQVTDGENLEFLRQLRGTINAWMKLWNAGELVISSRLLPVFRRDLSVPDLTSFDRRLVHQLVRTEYPNLVSIGRGNSVVIKEMNPEKEKKHIQQKKNAHKMKVSRQTGWRWIYEALCNGSFHGIDYKMFAKDPATGEARFCDIDDYSARMSRAKQNLDRRQPHLVGHNVFQDLVYLYRTFAGSLPPTFEEFAKVIHQLFPNVVDTKYLATHECGDLNPSSSLGDIELELRSIRKPEIILHQYHRKYQDEAPHEAGYDSYLTARIMIQLSTKLEALGTYSYDNASGSTRPVDSTFVSLNDLYHSNPYAGPPYPHHVAGGYPPPSADKMYNPYASNSCPHPTAGVYPHGCAGEMYNPYAVEAYAAQTMTVHRLSSFTVNLHLPVIADGQIYSQSRLKFTAVDANSYYPLTTAEYLKKVDSDLPMQLNKLGRNMPRYDSDFWRIYGNKLRVFGTNERLIDLSKYELSEEEAIRVRMLSKTAFLDY